ncbi:MAG: hypothetical protein H6Q99_1607 [Proteobacteria bacterium]|nr:hypothetical protein [Pseudomonadota bacterium]
MKPWPVSIPTDPLSKLTAHYQFVQYPQKNHIGVNANTLLFLAC